MKSPLLLVGAVLVPVAAAPALPRGPAPAPAPARLATQQSRYDEFVQKFQQAMGINAVDEMAKLVKVYGQEAMLRIDVICTQIGVQTSEKLEIEAEQLRRAWRKAYDSRFGMIMYEYLSLLDPPRRRERTTLVESYNRANAEFHENLAGSKEGPKFELIGEQFRGLAGAFEQVGDQYYVGRAWHGYSACFDKFAREKNADLRKATEGFGKAIAAYQKVELNNSVYHQAKQNYDTYVTEGWGPPEGGAEGEGPPVGVPTEAGATTMVAMTFEALEEIDQFERPNYFADELYQMWPSLFMREKGTSAAFPSIERGPLLLRTGSSQVEVDANRDGTGEVEVPMAGRFDVVQCTLGAGSGDERPWAFFARTGTQDDNYQGVKVNLQPDDNQLSIYYINAASMVGEIGGTPVRILDDNMDGVYGSSPAAWSYVGLSDKVTQPDMDSIVIGDSKRAVPWSEMIQIGEGWFKLTTIGPGKSFQVAPLDVTTGTLKVEFKGLKPDWLVVHGQGNLEHCFYDLLANGKSGVEVPAGSYKLYAGKVAKGKKQQTMKALILPGDSSPYYSVKPGEETVIQLGAPFSFDFNADTMSEKVVVRGRSVTIIGAGGERYERTWNCAPRPEVALRKEGSKKGGKPEKMDVVMSLDDILPDGTRVHTYDDAWRPLDLEIELKRKGDKVEIQLEEKKNKLFGSIESPWK